MSNAYKKKKFSMNIGSASILLVFVILCLVSFAVLSIVSANADSKLSNLQSGGTVVSRHGQNITTHLCFLRQ